MSLTCSVLTHSSLPIRLDYTSLVYEYSIRVQYTSKVYEYSIRVQYTSTWSVSLTLLTHSSLPKCVQTGRARMWFVHCFQSPFSRARAPAIITSRVVSGGPESGLRSELSNTRCSRQY